MEDKYTQNSVVNYSTFDLNEHHISLLSKGLKFCPTPGNPNTGDLCEDMDKLHTRMRWTALFENPEDNPDPSVDPLPTAHNTLGDLSFEPCGESVLKVWTQCVSLLSLIFWACTVYGGFLMYSKTEIFMSFVPE